VALRWQLDQPAGSATAKSAEPPAIGQRGDTTGREKLWANERCSVRKLCGMAAMFRGRYETG